MFKKNQILKILLLVSIFFITACATQRHQVFVPETLPVTPAIKKPKIVLVLGGGGSKSIAHLGALEVLEKNGIPIDLIVGTSAGSTIGALYADNPDVSSIKKKLILVKKWEILDPSLSNTAEMFFSVTGPILGNAYQKFLAANIKSKNIESLRIPLICVTTDIEKNELFLIKSGPIAPAVHASSAIPPFFAPVKLYGKTLVDGGVIAPVPVAIARTFNPEVIIAVDISAPPPKTPLKNMLDLTYRSIWIYSYELSRMQSQTADFNIHPNLDGHGMFDDDQKEKLYQAGKIAAEDQIEKIKARLKELKIPLKEVKNSN